MFQFDNGSNNFFFLLLLMFIKKERQQLGLKIFIEVSRTLVALQVCLLVLCVVDVYTFM